MFNLEDKQALMNKMLGMIDPTETVIKKTLMACKYDVAFRQACGSKLYSLILLMLENLDTLSIDLNAKSSNGNTALDWLDSSATRPFSDQYLKIRATLCHQGA